LTAGLGSFKVESEATTLLLPDLVKGKGYHISVAANNAVGQSPFLRIISCDMALYVQRAGKDGKEGEACFYIY
jgi:hypothetical protein